MTTHTRSLLRDALKRLDQAAADLTAAGAITTARSALDEALQKIHDSADLIRDQLTIHAHSRM